MVEVPTIEVLDFGELSRTPGVDQEMGPPQGKGKGVEKVPELGTGPESQKCDSCKQCGVECVRLQVSEALHSMA